MDELLTDKPALKSKKFLAFLCSLVVITVLGGVSIWLKADPAIIASSGAAITSLAAVLIIPQAMQDRAVKVAAVNAQAQIATADIETEAIETIAEANSPVAEPKA